MPGPFAHIGEIGMTTPVGGSVLQTAVALRAGLSAYRAGPFASRRGAPMTVATVPDEILPPLDAQLRGVGATTPLEARLLRLLAAAMPAIAPSVPPAPLPLFLALPGSVPGRSGVDPLRFLNLIAIQLKLTIDWERSVVVAEGRAGGMRALGKAIEALAAGPMDRVVWAGVDSYLDRRLLMTLDTQDRILAPGVPDGFCPGEGAAGMVLSRAQQPSGARVFAPGLADEPGHRNSQEPYRGDGLALAVAAAAANSGLAGMRRVLSSMNGESHWAKEWGVARMRSAGSLSPDVRLDHPASCFGDMGAAFAPILVGLAAASLVRAPDSGACLAYCSSDDAPRGAACVAAAAAA